MERIGGLYQREVMSASRPRKRLEFEIAVTDKPADITTTPIFGFEAKPALKEDGEEHL